jgi:hypothetical protein
LQDPYKIDSTLKELYNWFGYETYGCDGYCTTEEENLQIDAVAGHNASGYGEITPAGFRELASDIGLGENDVFFDLGSGVSTRSFQTQFKTSVIQTFAKKALRGLR